MAILGKVAGTMLKDNLVRNGVDLILDGNLMYWDVANRRVGIATTAPGNTLTVNGYVTASNVLIADNVVQSFNGNLILNSSTGNIAASNLRISNVANAVYASDVTTKSYVDASILNISFPNLYVGNSNTGNTNIILGTETLNLVGNTNQINVAITSETATFSLASSLVVQNVTLTGNATLNGRANLNTMTAATIAAGTIGNSGALVQGTNALFTGNIGVGSVYANGAAGSQFIGYVTGAVGANVPNSGVFTSVTTTSGGQVTGYLTGAIGANTPNTGVFTNVTTSGSSGNISGANYIFASLFSGNLTGAVGNINPNVGIFTSVTTVSGGQLTGYHTGPVGANTANTGVFTTLTATSGFQGAVNGPLNGTVGATTPNTGVFTSVTTVSGGQVTGYMTGPIGANTANTGVFTATTATSGNIGNLYIHDNTLASTNTDGNISLQPNGNGVVVINTSTALSLPYGNNITRPPNPSIGAFRYNTYSAALEYWDGDTWHNVTATTYTTIFSDTFVGNGVLTNFVLTDNSTTSGTLVSVNGVLQIPDTAYSISGNVLSFYEAPLSSDVIEARTVTTTAGVNRINVGNSLIYFDSASTGYALKFMISDVDRVIMYPANTYVTNTLVANAGIVSGNSNISLVQNANTTVDSFALSTYRTGKYIVSVSDYSNSRFSSAELLVTHNGTTANISRYGNSDTGINFVTFYANVSGSNVNLLANSISASSYLKFQKFYVTV